MLGGTNGVASLGQCSSVVQQLHPLLSLPCCYTCISGCRKTNLLWQGDGWRLLFDYGQPVELTPGSQRRPWHVRCFAGSSWLVQAKPRLTLPRTGRTGVYLCAGSCVWWRVWRGWGASLSSPKADLVTPVPELFAVVSLTVATLRFKRVGKNRCWNLWEMRFTCVEGLKSFIFICFCFCLFAF